jgi:hypothetical protein
MSSVATAVVASIAAPAIGSLIGGDAAGKSADAQIEGANLASSTELQAQREAIEAQEKAIERQIELNEPFRLAGVEALPALIKEIEAGAPTFDDFMNSPEAAAIREQELEDIRIATERSAASKGNLFAPATQIELQKRAMDITSASKLGQYQNVLARRRNDINDRFNIVNIGRGAATTQASDIGASGSNISNIITSTGSKVADNFQDAGAARASRYINRGNLYGNAVNQIGGNLITTGMLN